MRLKLKDFIKAHQHIIDKEVRKAGVKGRISYEERRLWVMNDYKLYKLAKNMGVDIENE